MTDLTREAIMEAKPRQLNVLVAVHVMEWHYRSEGYVSGSGPCCLTTLVDEQGGEHGCGCSFDPSSDMTGAMEALRKTGMSWILRSGIDGFEHCDIYPTHTAVFNIPIRERHTQLEIAICRALLLAVLAEKEKP